MAPNPFKKDPAKAWDDNIAALRRRRDLLDHALADQQEQCPNNPNNGGDGQGPARYPTVERQARQRGEGSG
jgi:hypothetical protein